MSEETPAGDSISPERRIIEVRVAGLRQLFHSMDPSPFRERDLDPGAEAFIVGWSRELPRDAPLALLVHLDHPAGPADEAAVVRDGIHQFFADRSLESRRRLRLLLRLGRTSLLIGLAFLGASLVTSELLGKWTTLGGIAILRESLLIGGWVAMWRPLEIFLYDWWPIRSEARLFDRLATMPVGIRYASTSQAGS